MPPSPRHLADVLTPQAVTSSPFMVRSRTLMRLRTKAPSSATASAHTATLLAPSRSLAARRPRTSRPSLTMAYSRSRFLAPHHAPRAPRSRSPELLDFPSLCHFTQSRRVKLLQSTSVQSIPYQVRVMPLEFMQCPWSLIIYCRQHCTAPRAPARRGTRAQAARV